MGTQAVPSAPSAGAASKSEQSTLTILDIVKHAVTTIINTLDEKDRLSLVSYSSFATLVFPLLPMSESGRMRATNMLKTLRADGMTNIWDGLKTGLDVLRAGADVRGGLAGNASVLLLTDGVPNKEPPKPYLQMLEDYRLGYNGKLPGTITTFGFGYQLNSPLLLELAHDGGAHYGFIPDPGMVGTAFVNALANIMSTSVKGAVLELTPTDGAQFVDKPLGSLPCVTVGDAPGNGLRIDLGDLQISQSRDVLVRMELPDGQDGSSYLRAALTYKVPGDALEYSMVTVGPPITRSFFEEAGNIGLQQARANELMNVAAEKYRLRAVVAFNEAIQLSGIKRDNPTNDLAGGRIKIADLTDELSAWLSNEGDALHQACVDADDGTVDPFIRMEALLEDLQGQGVQAFSRPDWYYKWGVHYIPSLARAHQLQQCSNFKDPGVQHYGGSVFRHVRDHADEVFCNLPPPGDKAKNIDMKEQYNNRDNPCFHGDCEVQMADGSLKRASEVVQGDKVMGASGCTETVMCVVRTEIDGGVTELVELPSKLNGSGPLLVTPWHPVLVQQSWSFPAMVSPQTLKARECEAVYSFVLHEQKVAGRRGSMGICGYEVATLGHGVLGDPVLSHEFFGSEAVLEALSKGSADGWAKGLIRLKAGAMLRGGVDQKSVADSDGVGRVVGIKENFVL